MIQRSILVLVLFCVSVSKDAEAQNSHWQGVAPWTTWQYSVNTLFEDTLADRLYIGGFTSNGCSYYDGTSIVPMGSPTCSNGIRKMVKFNDTLYAAAFCAQFPLMKWNGVDWDTTGLATDGNIWSLYVSNGYLYVGGWFTTIAGIAADGLARFDGTNWSAVGNLSLGYNYGIYAITEYNGELYIGGNFADSAMTTKNILRWNGSQWNTVGGGFYGGMDEVADFEVYENVLYIGGTFTVGAGNAGNYIVQWDGTTMSDVGGGVIGINNGNGQIHDLMVYDSALYAAGVFHYAGGISASRIARWDGTNWCGFGDIIDNRILALGTYRGELYIGGDWWTIGGDTIVTVAKWIGGNYVDTCGNTTGIELVQADNRTLPFPNPTSEAVNFQFSKSHNSRVIVIYDQLGREILREETNDNAIAISVSDFAAGIYFYSIQDAEGSKSKGKFVVVH